MMPKGKPDYTSRVPHYTFAETLEQQELQLKENPLLRRMIAARKELEGVRIVRSITMSIRRTCSMTPTGSASGRAAGTSSTRPTRPRTRASTGGTPSATT